MTCIVRRRALRILPVIGPVFTQRVAPGRTPRSMIGGPPNGSLEMGTMQLTDNQSTTLRINPNTRDKKGNPAAPIDAGSVTYLVDNPNLLTLGTPAADGFSVPIAAVGPLGTAIVTVNATAGGQPCSGKLTVPIVSDAPESIDIAGDPPVEQP
jgi:hypothetical protein